MTAFDTDVLSDIIRKKPGALARLGLIAPTDRAIPVVAAGEILRGWLATVRQAEAGKGRATLPQAYANLSLSIETMGDFPFLPYTPSADAQFRAWRAAKLQVGTQDLRIAAICVAHDTTLVTRNARDYTLVPDLKLDIWT